MKTNLNHSENLDNTQMFHNEHKHRMLKIMKGELFVILIRQAISCFSYPSLHSKSPKRGKLLKQLSEDLEKCAVLSCIVVDKLDEDGDATFLDVHNRNKSSGKLPSRQSSFSRSAKSDSCLFLKTSK